MDRDGTNERPATGSVPMSIGKKSTKFYVPQKKSLFPSSQWRLLCSRYQVAQAYMEDVNARVTVFAPVNDVFLYNPDLRSMDQKEVLSHIGQCTFHNNKSSIHPFMLRPAP